MPESNVSTGTVEETLMTSEEAVCDAKTIYKEELEAIQALPPPDPAEISKRMVTLGTRTKKATLVLDLDETLVMTLILAEGELPGVEDGLLVQERPHVAEFLVRTSALFELVVFTAAEEEYAEKVVRQLDPEHKLIKRVLSRSHCIPLSNSMLVKDLRIFADRTLDELIIVDNNIMSFAFQLPNGIPVLPFGGGLDDDELLFLAGYLEQLALETDIVPTNQKHFGLV